MRILQADLRSMGQRLVETLRADQQAAVECIFARQEAGLAHQWREFVPARDRF